MILSSTFSNIQSGIKFFKDHQVFPGAFNTVYCTWIEQCTMKLMSIDRSQTLYKVIRHLGLNNSKLADSTLDYSKDRFVHPIVSSALAQVQEYAAAVRSGASGRFIPAPVNGAQRAFSAASTLASGIPIVATVSNSVNDLAKYAARQYVQYTSKVKSRSLAILLNDWTVYRIVKPAIEKIYTMYRETLTAHRINLPGLQAIGCVIGDIIISIYNNIEVKINGENWSKYMELFEDENENELIDHIVDRVTNKFSSFLPTDNLHIWIELHGQQVVKKVTVMDILRSCGLKCNNSDEVYCLETDDPETYGVRLALPNEIEEHKTQYIKYEQGRKKGKNLVNDFEKYSRYRPKNVVSQSLFSPQHLLDFTLRRTQDRISSDDDAGGPVVIEKSTLQTHDPSVDSSHTNAAVNKETVIPVTSSRPTSSVSNTGLFSRKISQEQPLAKKAHLLDQLSRAKSTPC